MLHLVVLDTNFIYLHHSQFVGDLFSRNAAMDPSGCGANVVNCQPRGICCHHKQKYMSTRAKTSLFCWTWCYFCLLDAIVSLFMLIISAITSFISALSPISLVAFLGFYDSNHVATGLCAAEDTCSTRTVIWSNCCRWRRCISWMWQVISLGREWVRRSNSNVSVCGNTNKWSLYWFQEDSETVTSGGIYLELGADVSQLNWLVGVCRLIWFTVLTKGGLSLLRSKFSHFVKWVYEARFLCNQSAGAAIEQTPLSVWVNFSWKEDQKHNPSVQKHWMERQ